MLLPIGLENFQELIQKKINFVDKTLFIQEVLDDIANKVILITRPRRFGKTLNLSMLRYFLAESVHGVSTQGLFDGLKIADCGQETMQHQGQYPVIFVSFKDIKHATFNAVSEKLLDLFVSLFDSHNYLLANPKVTDAQKRYINSVLYRKVTITQLENALKTLSEALYLHHGIKPWLLHRRI